MQFNTISIFSVLCASLWSRTFTGPFPSSTVNLITNSFVFGLAFYTSKAVAQNDEIYPEGLDHDEEDDDNYLTEILAEEQREAEELEKMEAQMRELDELKAQQLKMKHHNQEKMTPGGMPKGIPGGSNNQFQKMEEELRQKEAIAQEMKQQDNDKAREEAAKAKAEERAKEKEAAFQAEVARAKDEKAKKKLIRQKAKDSRIVKKILRNGMMGNHYAVLGLRCRYGEIRFGPFKFCVLKNGDIKKAYRKVARLVHPDKNRDGRAEEAFDLLEKSSSTLLDEKKRKEFDAKLKRQRQERIQQCLQIWNGFMKTMSTMKSILGPFATPIIILVVLII